MTLKKLISVFITVMMLVSALSSAMSVSATMLYRKGDLNHDGTINAIDSYSLKTGIAGATGETMDQTAADVNGDGVINAADSYAMKLHMSGKGFIDQLYPEGCGWQGFFIMGTPISEYTVLVTDPDNPNMVFAAEELKKYVKLGDPETVLSIENSSSSAEKQIILRADSTGEMGTDGFNIKTEGDDLIITAGALRGTMYAVYELLESYYGYRFYPYGDYELDKNSPSNVPEETDDTQIPRVRYRCVGINGYHNSYVESSTIKNKLSGSTDQSALLQARYGWGIERSGGNGHSFKTFIPEEKMSLQNLTKRCLSDEKIFNICVETMLEYIEAKLADGRVIGHDLTEVTCSYDDSDVPCACRKCGKINREEGAFSGNLVYFVNRVHEKIMKVYPDIRIVMTAYGEWHDAPEKATLNEGITLLYCWNGCANHLLGSDTCSDKGNYLGTTNKKTEADFLKWTERCSDIYVWYYPTNIYYMLSPQPNFENLYNDFRWFINNGANGFYVKGTDGGSFESLDGYLISRLMWDPDMTKDEYELLIKEYLKDTYGYGWMYIYEYMGMLTEAGNLKGCVLNDFELPFDIYSRPYFEENYDRMCYLFDMALNQADTDEERENIERLSVHMHFLGLSAVYESRYVNGTEEQREAYADKWQWLYNYIDSNSMTVSNTQRGIDSPFTLEKSPMVVIYGEDVGDGER